MSYKFGASLVPGSYHFGLGGLGVPGASIPSTGTDGPSILYNDLSLPADAAVEVRALVTIQPVGLTSFNIDEYGGFLATGPDGLYTFTYRLYADGVDMGLALVTFGIGVTTTTGAGSDGGKSRRKKFVVKQGDKLLFFTDEKAAAAALKAGEESAPEADVAVDLPEVDEYAKRIGQQKKLDEAKAAKAYQEILAMFEQMRDEEDIEMLLLHDA